MSLGVRINSELGTDTLSGWQETARSAYEIGTCARKGEVEMCTLTEMLTAQSSCCQGDLRGDWMSSQEHDQK